MTVELHANDDTASSHGPLDRGRYELRERIGLGAMGSVHRARQKLLGRDVAIKIIHSHIAQDRRFVAAFLREACAGAQIDHPNVARTFDAGRDRAGRCFIVMELLEGRVLSDVLDRVPVPPLEWTVAVVAQVLGALSAAHDKGILHRDVKPDNIMVQHVLDDDGHAADLVKVFDFSIARVPGVPLIDDRGRPLTFEGTLCGTPGYMSPEQCEGQEVDDRSDLYSVGVLLYEMVTGRLPFDEIKVSGERVSRPIPDPTESCPGLPPELKHVILRALRERPEHRYSSARSMRKELLASLKASPGPRMAPSLEHLLWRSSQAHTRVARASSGVSDRRVSTTPIDGDARAARTPPSGYGWPTRAALAAATACALTLGAIAWHFQPELPHSLRALAGSPLPAAKIAGPMLGPRAQE